MKGPHITRRGAVASLLPALRPEILAMPPTITLEQGKGLSLFMVKAVLNGRGDEIIDLAKVNLFR